MSGESILGVESRSKCANRRCVREIIRVTLDRIGLKSTLLHISNSSFTQPGVRTSQPMGHLTDTTPCEGAGGGSQEGAARAVKSKGPGAKWRKGRKS